MLGAETVLPPGQSGFVSIAGVASGTGSPAPHRPDRPVHVVRLQVRAVRPGRGQTSTPAGRREDRARPLRRAGGDRRQRLRRLVGRRLRGGPGPAVPARAVPPRHQRPAGRDPRRQLPGRRPDRPPRLLHRRRARPDDRRASRRRCAGAPRPTATASTPGSAEARARPDASCRASSPRWACTPPTWTLRDTARVGVFLARTVPSGDGARARERPRAARSWAPRASTSCCRCAPGPRVHRAGARRAVPVPAGPHPQGRSARAFTRSQRFVAGLSAAAPPRPRLGVDGRASRAGSSRAAAPTCGRSGARRRSAAQVQAPQGQAAAVHRYRRPKAPATPTCSTGRSWASRSRSCSWSSSCTRRRRTSAASAPPASR